MNSRLTKAFRTTPIVIMLAITSCSGSSDKTDQPETPEVTIESSDQSTPAASVSQTADDTAVDPAIAAVDDDLASLDGDLQVIDDALAELDTIAP